MIVLVMMVMVLVVMVMVLVLMVTMQQVIVVQSNGGQIMHSGPTAGYQLVNFCCMYIYFHVSSSQTIEIARLPLNIQKCIYIEFFLR